MKPTTPRHGRSLTSDAKVAEERVREAAPDLLAALEPLYEAALLQFAMCAGGAWKAMADVAAAALAKARGGSGMTTTSGPPACDSAPSETTNHGANR